MGVKILGTSAENVDAAEDRELFDEILENARSRDQRDRQYLLLRKLRKQQMSWVILFWFVLPMYLVVRA